MKNIYLLTLHFLSIFLIVIKITSSGFSQDCPQEESSCPICLEKMDVYHPGKKSYCLSTVDHEFHESCLDGWKSSSCPLCRTPMNHYFPYVVERLEKQHLLGPHIKKKDLINMYKEMERGGEQSCLSWWLQNSLTKKESLASYGSIFDLTQRAYEDFLAEKGLLDKIWASVGIPMGFLMDITYGNKMVIKWTTDSIDKINEINLFTLLLLEVRLPFKDKAQYNSSVLEKLSLQLKVDIPILQKRILELDRQKHLCDRYYSDPWILLKHRL